MTSNRSSFFPGQPWPDTDGDHIWLSIQFDHDGMVIEWMDEWDMSIFDQ